MLHSQERLAASVHSSGCSLDQPACCHGGQPGAWTGWKQPSFHGDRQVKVTFTLSRRPRKFPQHPTSQLQPGHAWVLWKCLMDPSASMKGIHPLYLQCGGVQSSQSCPVPHCAWFLHNQQKPDFVPNCAIPDEACSLMEFWCLEVQSKLLSLWHTIRETSTGFP